MKSYEEKIAERDENAARARGFVLHRTVELEMLINLYLSTHFCGKTKARWELINTVLATNKITLDSKIEVFREMVTIHNPEFVTSNPLFLTDFKNIVEKRNVFAHLHLDVGEDAMSKSDSLSFLKFKKNTYGVVEITHEEIKKLLENINKYILEVGNLIDL